MTTAQEILDSNDPNVLANIVFEQGRQIEELQRRFLELDSLDEITKNLGSGISTEEMTANTIHTNADVVDINWWLPLNLSSDDVTNIYAFAYDGTEYIYAGGVFKRIGGVQMVLGNIARYSLITRNWEEFNGGVNGAVKAIAIDGNGLVYIAGDFTDAGGVAAADKIAKASGSTWAALGSGSTLGVLCLAVDSSNNVYAGGEGNIGGVASSCIAKWNGSAWSAVGSSGANNEVDALVIDLSGNVIAGGGFTAMDAVANTAGIAKWNGSAWSAMGTGASGGTGYVNALAVDSMGNVIAGGGFALMGGVADTVGIAKWDGSAWSALGSGVTGTVASLSFDADDVLYAGGQGTTFGDIADTVAQWDGSVWLVMSNAGGTSGLDNTVFALLALDSGSVIAGGLFNYAGAIKCQSIALWCKPLSEAIDLIASLFELYSPTAVTSFTPTIAGSGTAGTGVYTVQLGRSKEANGCVHFKITLVWSNITGSPTGNLIVKGLPSISANDGMDTPVTVYWSSLTLAAVENKLMARVAANSTDIQLLEVGSGVSSNLPIDTAGTLVLAGFYFRS
jgi:hypothetical protein